MEILQGFKKAHVRILWYRIKFRMFSCVYQKGIESASIYQVVWLVGWGLVLFVEIAMNFLKDTEEGSLWSFCDFLWWLLCSCTPLFLKNWRLITLQYCSGFLPYIDTSQPWVYMCPHSEPHSHLPPHPISQCCPRALALSAPSHAWNLDWWPISHMVIYMFQCYCLKSSHPCLLPQSPKVCSLHLCLFCCPAHRVIVTIFLNSISMHYILYWCFSFWHTSLCIIGSSFIHLIRTDSNASFLMVE